MRILQVIHDFLPETFASSGISTYDLSRSLILNCGHDVSVFCREWNQKVQPYAIEDFAFDGLHVLATASSVAADLVRQSGIGCDIHPDDIAGLVQVLSQIPLNYTGFVKQYYHPNWYVINQYDRMVLAGQHTHVLENVARKQ